MFAHKLLVILLLQFTLLSAIHADPQRDTARERTIDPDLETEMTVGRHRLIYLRDPQVQRMLDMTTEQQEAIASIHIYIIAPPSAPVQGTEARLAEILDGSQLKLLRQIELQESLRTGLHELLLRKDVATDLHLSEGQKERIRDLTRKYHQDRDGIRVLLRQKKADGADLHRLRVEFEKSLTDTLTEEQRQQWVDMLGPKHGLNL